MTTGIPPALDADGPKGGQLRAILLELVGGLTPGDPLPSERALADRYGIARGTVRAEVDRLAAEGVIERVHGRGTFVAEPRFEQAERYSSFTEDMRARGLEPGSAVLRQEVVPAPAEAAAALDLEPEDPVVLVERLRTADGRPMAIEEVWLPAARFAALAETDLATGSLIEALDTGWGVRIAAGRQRVVAVVVDAVQARLLGVAAGSPALRFTTVADDGTQPVYRATSLFRSDRYEIELDQRR
jgi:GntR family transcriptional regulator